ncbi:helix-turn-helix domain-containing protein [Alteromonas sp. CI.11.F.A3]|uniref:IclR family transcriptional regulator n=1 Tax=Alteromonas sp. CI.11.F.A3 TaxID=3079555 RepID=UPI002943348F|nr:helix-turn-helix domain-containing protein [Alteromonas sp. CI.11.F.A3]WOI38379.1 helix-turn-helix domain-containing protein [Alteromonas sp. CI.11.F.A3]
MERYIIPSVFQAIQLCQFIAESKTGLTATQIEVALHLPRTSVFRLLKTLSSERIIEKRGTRYFYGSRVYEISSANSRARYVQRLIAPSLASLLTSSDCSAIICVPGDYCAFVIDVLDAHPSRISSIRPGSKLPLFHSAPGHIMLTHHDRYEPHRYSEETTFFDQNLATKHRTEVCTRGYAMSYYKKRNTTLLSVPVFIKEGELVAMLAVELEGEKTDYKALQAWGEKLKSIARILVTYSFTDEEEVV